MSRTKRKRTKPRENRPARATPGSRSHAHLKQTLIPAAAIILAVIVAYLPALEAGYIWDDPRYVTENPCLLDTEGLKNIWTDLGSTVQYYPLVFTTFWIEYHIWQLDPTGYHLVNILLHAIAAGLLFLVLRRISLPGAWLAAAIFALHPIEVESVAWITERKNVLAGFFYLAALLSYLHFAPLSDPAGQPRQRRKYYVAALVLFLCALFSKTVTCSLPAAILLLIWWKRGRLTTADILPLVPMFLAGAALASVTAWMEKNVVRAVGSDWALSTLERLLIAGRALWFYIWKLILPVELTFNYPRWDVDTTIWWQWLFPLAAVSLVVVLWSYRRRLGRGPLVTALFFGGTLLPALGFTNTYPMRYSFVADHFQYLAGIGPLTLASVWLVKVLGDRSARSGRKRPAKVATSPALLYTVGGVILVVLAVLTLHQTRIYKDRQTLWLDTLEKNPGSFLGHNNLGAFYMQQGRNNLAIEHFQEAVRFKPDFHKARANLGRMLAERGNIEDGLVHLTEAVRLKPDAHEVQNRLANLLAQKGDFDEAILHYKAAIRLRPDLAVPHNNLANVYAQQEKFGEAIPHYRAAISYDPENAVAFRNLGLALAASGDVDEAIASFRQAVALQPEDAIALINLAELLAEKGETDAAIKAYRAALRINPDHVPARQALDALLAIPGTSTKIKAGP